MEFEDKMKKLKKLSRLDLIEIIYQLQKNEIEILEENKRLKTELESRQLKVSKVGSLAEASLEVNNIFEKAQSSANQYVSQVKTIMNSYVDKKVDAILEEAKEMSMLMLKESDDQLVETGKLAQDRYEKLKSESGIYPDEYDEPNDEQWIDFAEDLLKLKKNSEPVIKLSRAQSRRGLPR